METIKQLSVFLENKSGRLNEILSILGEHNVSIIAASVADTSEYGILRVITSDTEEAIKALKESKISANISEVIAIGCDSVASAYAQELAKLAHESICIEYMYSFSCKGKAILIIRTSNNEQALVAAAKHNICTYTQAELDEV